MVRWIGTEVPLQGEVSPRINNQCRQWFLCRKLRVNHKTWNGTGKSASSSSFRMSTDIPHWSYHPARMQQHGWDPSVSPGTKCLWWIVKDWLKAWSLYQLVVQGFTKGWACEVAEKGSDWLGSMTGLHTKVYVRERLPGCATRLWSLMGKATHLCRVYELWLVTPCSGKELQTRQERDSMKFYSTCEGCRT
jgi:hypothetical protein